MTRLQNSLSGSNLNVPLARFLAGALLIMTSLCLMPGVSRAAEDENVYIAFDQNGKPALNIMFRHTYKLVYDDHDSGAKTDVSAFVIEPGLVSEGFLQLGHLMYPGRPTNPNGKVVSILVKDASPDGSAVRPPTGTSFVWNDHGSGGSHDLEVFTLDCPDNYVAIGSVLRGDGGNGWGIGGLPPGSLDAAKLGNFACLRKDLTDIGKIEKLIWTDAGSGANGDFSAWSMTYVKPLESQEDNAIRLNSGSFVANGSHAKPENSRAMVLKFNFPTDPAELQKWMDRAKNP
jgi:hypothetical protein